MGSGDRPYQSVKDALKGKRRSDYFTQSRIIPKGTKMFRTTTNPNEILGKTTYVTYTEADRDLYKGGYIRFRDNKKEAYEMQIKLNSDIKIPSRQEFKDSINQVIKKNPKLLKESVRAYWEEFIPENSWDRYEIMEDPDTGELDTTRWDKFVNDSYSATKDIPIEEQWGTIAMSLGRADKLKDAIITDLSKKGYNAITDEAGVGGDGRVVEGIDPLIIFDSNVLDVTNVSRISEREERKSKKDYTNWQRKSRQAGYKGEW